MKPYEELDSRSEAEARVEGDLRGGVPEELGHLSDRSANAQEIGGHAFWRGEIAGREVLVRSFIDGVALHKF